jgi:hypothetical protein
MASADGRGRNAVNIPPWEDAACATCYVILGCSKTSTPASCPRDFASLALEHNVGRSLRLALTGFPKDFNVPGLPEQPRNSAYPVK